MATEEGSASRSSAPAPPWGRRTKPESRLAVYIAIALVIGVQLGLAFTLSLKPVWVLPAISAVLLLASAAVYIPSRNEPRKLLRVLSLTLVAVLVAANVIGLAVLVQRIFAGSGLTAARLILGGGTLWVANIIVFALIHWEMDSGGPEARADGDVDYPDFVFPQQENYREELAPPDWKPDFFDYLFVSLTTATAFSPTDAMPYSTRAKMVMGVEAVMSFAIAAMLFARAINIAHG